MEVGRACEAVDEDAERGRSPEVSLYENGRARMYSKRPSLSMNFRPNRSYVCRDHEYHRRVTTIMDIIRRDNENGGRDWG